MGYVSKLAFGLVLGATAFAANAQNLLFANSAGSNRIDVLNRDTGVLIRSCNPAKGNGRGIVVIGNLAYFTTADANIVYKMDINTCADLGTAFSVTGATSLSTIAYDGTNFWIGDYSSSSNKAFLYSPTGTLIRTITLSMCVTNCDGLEYFNGKLISNRGDSTGGPYDVYDLNGVLLQAAFITNTPPGTGIAFDGTNFYVSNFSAISVYNGTTGAFIRKDTLTGGSGFLIEDLSTDYAQRTDTGGGPKTALTIPTLSEWGLILLMLVLGSVAALRVRRR